jgi:divalent metal cation (Fe/Co/Zn/Cd) transporter
LGSRGDWRPLDRGHADGLGAGPLDVGWGVLAILWAQKPADEDHAFGHSSVEDLAALMQSVFVLVSAGVIAVAALRRLVAEDPPRSAAEGVGVAVLGCRSC